MIKTLPVFSLQTFCVRCNEFGSHDSHSDQVVDISAAASRWMKDREVTMQAVIDAIPVLEVRRENTLSVVQEINNHAECVSSDVTKSAERAIQEIRQAEKTLLDRVDEARWKRLKPLDSYEQNMKEAMEKSSRALAMMKEDSFSKLTDTEQLQMRNVLNAAMLQALQAQNQTPVCDGGPALVFDSSKAKIVHGELRQVKPTTFSVTLQEKAIKAGSQLEATVHAETRTKMHGSMSGLCVRESGGAPVRVPVQIRASQEPATVQCRAVPLGSGVFPLSTGTSVLPLISHGGGFSFGSQDLFQGKICKLECTPKSSGRYSFCVRMMGMQCPGSPINFHVQVPLAQRFSADKCSKAGIRLEDEQQTACCHGDPGYAVGDAIHNKGAQCSARFRVGGLNDSADVMTLGVMSSAEVADRLNLKPDEYDQSMQGFTSAGSNTDCRGETSSLSRQQRWKNGDVIRLELDGEKGTLTGTHERTGRRHTIDMNDFPVAFAFFAKAVGQKVTIV